MKTRNHFLTALLLVIVTATFVQFDAEAQAIAGKSKEAGAWLGVRLKSVKTEKIVDGKKDLGESVEKGAVVDDVVDGGPAEKAGLKKGDIIVAIGERKIEDADDIVAAMRESEPGTKVNLSVLRDGKNTQLEAELTEAKAGAKEKRVISKNIRVPRAPHPPMAPMIWSEQGSGYGFSLNTLNSQLGEYFGAPNGKGVLIEQVEEDSDAAKAGFKAGDVIVRAGKKTVTNVSDFRSVLGAFDAGEKIPVDIIRKGSRQTIQLTAKEQEKGMSMLNAPGLGGLFRFHGNGGGAMDMEDLENMDIDIDIDADDMEEGMKRMRIMLNGKELELEGLNETLREAMEEMHLELENIEEGGDDERRVIRIQAKQI